VKSYISLALITSVSLSCLANAQDVEVLGGISVVDKSIYGERVSSIKPVLAYDSKFFDRYEARTVGEMLKFLPGVAFQGDVGEYDFVKLRGLSSAYTQVLINGNRVPGTEADGSASLDLIPAEMVERIEIIRSPSASNDSAGMAGTINIILKEAGSSSKFAYRLGGAYYGNGKAGSDAKGDQKDGGVASDLYGNIDVTKNKFKGLGYLSYSDLIGETAFTFSANIDDKYTPKDKVTVVKDSSGALDEYENEYDNRDTLTKSLYLKTITPMFGADELMLAASYFNIDRTEEQREISYKNYDANTKLWELDEVQHQIMDIDKDATNLQLEYTHNAGAHKIKFYTAYDKLNYTLHDYEAKGGKNLTEVDDINAWMEERVDENTVTKDTQYNVKVTDAYQVTDKLALDFGLDYLRKDRSTVLRTFEVENGVVSDTEVADKGTYSVVQNRFDLFAEGNYEIDSDQRIGAGVRLENTKNKAAPAAGDETETSYTTVNPSLHYLVNMTKNDTIRASLAQTVRRPSFDEIVPFEQKDEPREDDVLIGNPDLKPEKSAGLDLGYEHAFQEGGVFGVNTYYRDITDLIEYSPTGKTVGSGKEYIVSNNGDAKVYGVELDLNMPLSFLDIPQVSIIANYSYLDSEVIDFFTGKKRRFNDQPEYVYNLGLVHNIDSLGVSYGFNYQKRGDSIAESADTTEVTSYGAGLELFASYQVSKTAILRLTVDNALNSSVDESFTVYDSTQDKIDGVVKEYETQSEKAGPRFMLTLSGSF
jgi:outer membrane receptor for ferrienterochelin and colicins